VLCEALSGWRPPPVDSVDVIRPEPGAALAGLLGRPGSAPAAGEPLPPLWHWLAFLTWTPPGDLGADGHPRDGHFLPPLPDRRRVQAGGRAQFVAPLAVGAEARRRSELVRAEPKTGRSGELLLVTLRHVIAQGDGDCVVEEQDLIYRSGPAAVPTAAAPTTVTADAAPVVAAVGEGERVLPTGPTVLFGFSALTANAHRIHYDADYARDVEGYPGLVVHGPLVVLAMLELLRAEWPERPVREITYRFSRPFFAGRDIRVAASAAGDGVELTATAPGGPGRASARVGLGGAR
jgi:3-methylfumaryl-CoA hydratase